MRIFALARELGLDSKVLIEICANAGITLRNALATVTPEEREKIIEIVRSKESGGAAPAADTKELAPSRDDAAVPSKGREIRSLSSGRGSSKADEAEEIVQPDEAEAESVAEESAEPVEETEEPVTADETAEVTAEESSDAEVAAESDSETAETAAEDETESPAAETDPEPETADAVSEEADVAVEPETPTATAEESSDDGDGAAAGEKPPIPVGPVPGRARSSSAPVRPMQRMSSGVREMKPIGSVSDRSERKEPPAPKPAVASAPPAPNVASPPPAPPVAAPKNRPAAKPMVAAPPSYTPPTIEKKQAKAEKVQKPEMALSDIVDRQMPLSDQLRQLKKAQEEADNTGGRGGRGRGERGSLLKQMKASREAERAAILKKGRRRKRGAPAELKTTAQIDVPITVRSLSEALGRPARAIMSILFKEGRMVTINDELSEEDALEISIELGVDLEVRRGRDKEQELLDSLDHDDDPETMQARPPIITILGHVDHGKTTLVDRLRQSEVAAGEAGGITQHIAAYQVNHEGRLLTFVDTPGHAAFGEMRARGANVTDIVVLVIAADDGIMPQTLECISHAKSAGVPIVVALNKIDLPDVDEQKVLQQLAQHDMLPAEWGGEYEVVRTSGETGQGLDTLLETLLLTAELHEYQACPERESLGVCLEAFRDEGRGVIAWMIVQKGTLRVGDVVLCGTAYGRIRSMFNDRDEEVTEAGPSTPVRVTGLDSVPSAGVHFFEMADIDEAREMAENRIHEGREQSLSRRGKPRTIEDIMDAARRGEGIEELNVILKADTPGSLEALRGELEKFDHDEVKLKIIHEGIGGVNESDVYLASAGEAIIVAFHVIAEERAEALAEQEAVEIRRYNIIYEITAEIRQSLEGMLRPERVEVTTGRALVLQTFSISRFGTIAGCRVISGTISRDNRIHVIRDQTVLNSYRIGSLKREKDDAKEVREGMECGIRLDGFNDVKEGDLLEAYRIDEIQRKLDG